MAFTDRQKVRIEVADTDVNLPILSDAEYDYLLQKNSYIIRTTALDAARIILMKLSITSSDETVDIFSIKGAKAAEQYREALKLYIRSPDLNPILAQAMPYAGGISKADMLANDSNPDNNLAPSPARPDNEVRFGVFSI